MKQTKLRTMAAFLKGTAFVFAIFAIVWLLVYMLLCISEIIVPDGTAAGAVGSGIAWIVVLSLQIILCAFAFVFLGFGLFLVTREWKFSVLENNQKASRKKYIVSRVLSDITNLIAVIIALILAFSWGTASTVYWLIATVLVGLDLIFLAWSEILQCAALRKIKQQTEEENIQ